MTIMYKEKSQDVLESEMPLKGNVQSADFLGELTHGWLIDGY